MSIKDAVEVLAADRVPVLCLDTCDFLDVVRGVAVGNLLHAESFRVMLDNLGVTPKVLRPTITYLVRHEWGQNKDQSRKAVEQFLKVTATAAGRVAEAREIAGLPESFADESLFDPSLVGRLIELAEDVMDRAIVLEKDGSCVARALERVMSKRRPSHRNEIKDSIHWEHFLELSRELEAAGHDQPRIFVSANKSDFWRGDRPQLHADLDRESAEAGLLFFGHLNAALGKIGLWRRDSPPDEMG